MNHMNTFPSWPVYAEDEIEAALAVLKSGRVNYWTGEETGNFERDFSRYLGCKYAISLANGSVSLELALAVHDIGPGDSVVVPCRTFVATASSVVLRGAQPLFADVDPDSQNITVDSIKSAMDDKTRAVIIVHMAGWPCDMDSITEFTRENNLLLIEDCSQAHGARYKDRPVGSFGDAGCFSFCQDKIISTGGEGGMLVTNDENTWKRAWSYKDHGKNYDKIHRKQLSPGYQWVHDSPGTNWRMTEFQAAIGRVQLGKLDQWVEMRNRNAGILNDCFSDMEGLRITIPPGDTRHSYYKYYVFIRPEKMREKWTRDRIITEINRHDIAVSAGSCSELYRESLFSEFVDDHGKFLPVARSLGETSLMFQVHPTLQENDIHRICGIVKPIFEQAII